MDFIDELSNEYRLNVHHAIRLREEVVVKMRDMCNEELSKIRFRFLLFGLVLIIADVIFMWVFNG